MRRRVFRTGAVTVGVLALSGAGTLAAALPAYAAPTCPATTPAAVLLPGTSICEIRIVADTSVTIPSSVAKVGAVLVGAGGGGYDAGPGVFGYAGDGGRMTYISFAGDGVPRPVVVGSAGVGGSDNGPTAGEGGATIFNSAQAAGGASGQTSQAAFGEGAAESATDTRAGLVLSSVPGVDATLFPVGLDTFEYARGGTGDSDVNDAPLTTAPAATDYGYGGHGLLDGGTSTDGVDGIAILRFAAVDDDPPVPPAPAAPTLPNTGVDATPGLIAAGGLLAAGGILRTLRRRGRSAA